MKKVSFIVILLSILIASSVRAIPWIDCYGGFDEDWNYWHLLDYFGYPLENGDWVYCAWTGPDEEIDPPDYYGYPTDDDVKLTTSIQEYIGYGYFNFVLATWAVGDLDSLGNQRHPVAGGLIYCRIFDAPQGTIGPGNYYADSQLHIVENIYGEIFLCVFPGDPGGGHTDTALPPGEVPVELMSFEAIGRDSQVLLEWATATEVDNFGFHIERSSDAVVFQRVTGRIIAGAGDSEAKNIYAYVDKGLTNEITYSYNLITVDMDGVEKVANEEPISATPTARVPAEFSLGQNYPNPFNPSTEIKYSLPVDTHTSLQIYNVTGQEIVTLVDNDLSAGSFTATWDGRDFSGREVAAGIYFCTMKAGEFTQTRKMVLLK